MTESRARLAQNGDEKELLKMWLSLFQSHAPEHVEAIRGYIEGTPMRPTRLASMFRNATKAAQEAS